MKALGALLTLGGGAVSAVMFLIMVFHRSGDDTMNVCIGGLVAFIFGIVMLVISLISSLLRRNEAEE